MHHILWIILVWGLSASLYATEPGDFSAVTTVSESSIPLDQTVTADLVLKFPSTHHVDLDALRANLLRQNSLAEPPFTLSAEKSTIKPRGKDGIMEGKLSFTLDPQLLGTHPLTFYVVTFVPNEDSNKEQKVEVVSPIFYVTVNPAAGDFDFTGVVAPLLTLSPLLPVEIDTENRMQFLKNPVMDKMEAIRNREIKQAATFPWQALAATLVFVIFVFALFVTQRRRGKGDVQEAQRAKNAHSQALKVLEGLDVKARHDIYYSAITDTVRRYIEDSYHIQAAHMTTEEFLQQMTTHPSFDAGTQQSLTRFLESADRVKFARYNPSFDECVSVKHDAEKFIGK